MADKKISDLNAITGANTADDDLFVIVDTSANETKKIAKSELVSTVNQALIDGAPATLDTLNELAAALNDDANFATTVTTALSTKLANIVEDTTPQLGGTLDANSNIIDMGVNTITDTKVGQWDTAYGWGDHSTAGYLTSFTETDPVFTAHVASGITATNITNWNTAYGWGDHSTAGYLTTETDPVFSASEAASITATDKTNWNTAYGWGDHASAGYLTGITANSIGITELNVTDGTNGQVLTTDGAGNLSFSDVTETDPQALAFAIALG